jgi:heme exporter protein A
MYSTFQLRVEHLLCVQQERPLFEPLNFALNNQQILLLHGPNGVGKTTCLRTLAGLLPPARGSVQWNKQSIANYNNVYLNNMAYLGHHSGIKLALTPTENLRTYLSLINREEQAALIPQVLEQVNLAAQSDIMCGQLSAGQQRRVSLARLFLVNKPLWILDEPLTALDVQGVGLLQTLITQHINEGGAVIVTSHQYFADATQTIELEPWTEC